MRFDIVTVFTIHLSLNTYNFTFTEEMRRIVLLLANTMSQSVLTQHISANFLSLTRLANQTEAGGEHENMASLFNQLTFQPRSLQTLSQYTVYKSLGRRITPNNVNRLPLPPSLKRKISAIV